MPNEGLAIIALRLMFGGAPGQYKWGFISESICDLVVRILHDDDCDTATLCVPKPDLVPTTELLDDSIPFGEETKLIVDVPGKPRDVTDVYIDDTMGLTVRGSSPKNVIF